MGLVEKYFKDNILNKTPSKKLFKPYSSLDLINAILDKLGSMGTLISIAGYNVDLVSSVDREVELTDHRHKNNKLVGVDTYNIDKTTFYNLKILIEVNPNMLENRDDNRREAIKDANDIFLLSRSGDYVMTKNIESVVVGTPKAENSIIEYQIWVPKIENSFCEIGDSVYYIPFLRISPIVRLSKDKIRVIRLAIIDKSEKNSSKVSYYYLSIQNGVIYAEYFKNNVNLYHIYKKCGIDTTLFDEYAKTNTIAANTIKEYEEKYKDKHITIVDFDRSVDQALQVILGYKQLNDAGMFKYYRYGSILHSICTEIIGVFISSLPPANGPRSDRYYDASDEAILLMKENIMKKMKADKLFMSILLFKNDRQGDLKNTVNEHMNLLPLKCTRVDNPEQLLTEEEFGKQDSYGTAQTPNIMKTISIPPFIGDEYVE